MKSWRTPTPLPTLFACILLLALAAAGCSPAPVDTGGLPQQVPSPTALSTTIDLQPVTDTPGVPTPGAAVAATAGAETPGDVPTATVPPTLAPPVEPASAAEQAGPASFAGAPCEAEVCLSPGSFFLKRPVGAEGRNTTVGSARFGEYNRARKGAYHGAYFLNSTGAPVLAAADGVVVLAGDDSSAPLGPYRNLYGGLVIVQHALPGLDAPLYTLYGHLSEILVQANDPVTAGQEIGKVGMSGDVSGSILEFEVRLGENAYGSARNPDLWLEPLPGPDGALQGALAGRILDASGGLVSVPTITLEQLAGPGLPASDTYYLKTYSETSIRGQQPWGENFAAAGLPAGEYQISFWWNGLHQRVVEIRPGELTLATFRVE